VSCGEMSTSVPAGVVEFEYSCWGVFLVIWGVLVTMGVFLVNGGVFVTMGVYVQVNGGAFLVNGGVLVTIMGDEFVANGGVLVANGRGALYGCGDDKPRFPTVLRML
jgi:hypothetical protein